MVSREKLFVRNIVALKIIVKNSDIYPISESSSFIDARIMRITPTISNITPTKSV